MFLLLKNPKRSEIKPLTIILRYIDKSAFQFTYKSVKSDKHTRLSEGKTDKNGDEQNIFVGMSTLECSSLYFSFLTSTHTHTDMHIHMHTRYTL